MRILMLGAKSFPPEIGGIETHVYEISKELIRSGYVVSVVAGKYGKIPRYEKIRGVDVYRVPFIKSRFTTKITMSLGVLKKALELKPDIYHAHDAVMGFLATFLLRRKKPVVYTAHGLGFLRQDWPFLVQKIIKFMELHNIKKANKVIAVDYKTTQKIKKFRKDVVVIPNGVNLKELDKKRPYPKKFERKKINILFIGRLIPTKGPEILLQAFEGLPNEIKQNCVLHIIGTGYLEKKLKKLASGNVKIYGYVRDIRPHLQHCDIFVLPSLYEGHPIVLLEAMGCKKACISSRVGDLDKRFKNNTEVCFVNPGNVKELAAALRSLIVNAKKRKKLGAAARKKIGKQYTWKNTVAQLKRVYVGCKK